MWDLSHFCNLHHSLRPPQIPNPLSKARDRTRNLMVPSRFHFRSNTRRTPRIFFFFFIMKGCWSLSNDFSASIEMTIWFWTFLLLMWCMALIDLHVMNHPCESGMHPTCSWCVIFFVSCWIWLAQILLRMFVSVFLKAIGLPFSFLVVSLSGFGIRVMAAS